MTSPDRGRRRASAAFLTSFALSLYALLSPEVQGPGLVDLPAEDKVIHVALFALLATTARWRFGAPLLVGVALVGYGAATEAAQALWLDGRGGDLLDLAADVAGVAAGTALAGAWRPAAMGSVASDDPT